MDDSFLEELGLLSEQSKNIHQGQVDCHITTRRATSSPLLNFFEQDKRDNIIQPEEIKSTITVPNISDIKIKGRKSTSSKESKQQSDPNVKKQPVKAKLSEKNEEIKSKGKSVNTNINLDNNQQHRVSGKVKIRSQEARSLKVSENKTVNKDRNRRSVLCKDILCIPDTFIKENRCASDFSNNDFSDVSSKDSSRPMDSSKDNSSQDLSEEKAKLTNSRKTDHSIQNQNLSGLLDAIKESISVCTKAESTKILRALQELHINSQASLMKNFLYQSEYLSNEIRNIEGPNKFLALVEQKQQLEKEVIYLKLRNKELEQIVKETEFLKQENTALKHMLTEQMHNSY